MSAARSRLVSLGLSEPCDSRPVADSSHSGWRNLSLHTRSRVGWRRSDLVRRGAAHSIGWHCSPRNGWHLQRGPSVPCRKCRGSPRQFSAPDRQTNRSIARRACPGSRRTAHLPVHRQRWRLSRRCLVPDHPWVRLVLRDGSFGAGCTVGPILARDALLTPFQSPSIIGICCSSAANPVVSLQALG